jgi:hypothetical protein
VTSVSLLKSKNAVWSPWLGAFIVERPEHHFLFLVYGQVVTTKWPHCGELRSSRDRNKGKDKETYSGPSQKYKRIRDKGT